MPFVWISVAVVVLILAIAYVCYRMAFYAPPRKIVQSDEVSLPDGEIYEPFRPQFEAWAREVRAMPCEEMHITSFDGLPLHARYYEFSPDAPIELMFHGYRGNAERDLSGAVQRCFKLGHSALIVDQRCSGKSGGHTITFGVNEYRDCLSWLAFMQTRFGENARIILCGISMGASTVMMAAGQPLPPTVIGVLADCGYHSQKEIIQKVIRQIGLPPVIAYPFVKLGARLYGRFNLEEITPLESLKTCRVPVIFFHGENDDFVPCEMSRIAYDACPAKKGWSPFRTRVTGSVILLPPNATLVPCASFLGMRFV